MRAVHLFGRVGVPDLYTDEVHRLYEAVVSRSAVQFEHLPPEFPRELARRMPDNAVFTFVYRGLEIVGFSMALVSDTTFHGLVLGVDYGVNAQAEVYFNLLYHSLDFAFRHGARDICGRPDNQRAQTRQARVLPGPAVHLRQGRTLDHARGSVCRLLVDLSSQAASVSARTIGIESPELPTDARFRQDVWQFDALNRMPKYG